MATRDKLARYAPNLLTPPQAFLDEKLKLFNMSSENFQKLDPLIICQLRQGVVVRPSMIKPKLIDIVSHQSVVNPGTIDELKELAGVPNRAFATAPKQVPVQYGIESREIAALPSPISIPRLAPQAKQTFWQASHNILRGPTDPKMLASPGYKQVAAAMLKLARNIPVFLAPDLIVCDKDVVTFSGFGALYFNNVLVYGSGQIVLGRNTTLHAYQIKRV